MRITVLLWSLEDTESNQRMLAFLRWWSAEGHGPQPMVVSVREGWMRKQFATVSDIRVANDKDLRRPSGWLRRLRLHRIAGVVRSREIRRWFQGATDAVYLAEPAAARLLPWIADGPPVTCEMRLVDREWPELGDDAAILQARVTEWVLPLEVAPTEGVALRTAADLPALPAAVELDRVWRIPEFLPAAVLLAAVPGQTIGDRKRAARRWLGVAEDTPLVLSGGKIDWWAVPDAFVQLAWLLATGAGTRPAHVVWLAGESTDRMLWPLRHDVEHAGLGHRFHIVGTDRTPFEWTVAAEVCVRTGPPDEPHFAAPPFATIGLPVVRFGGPDISAPTDRLDGVEVPYLDLPAMRDVVQALIDDEPARVRLGGPADDDPAYWDARVFRTALVQGWASSSPR